MWLDRPLALLDDDAPALRESMIRGFEQVFVLLLVAEHWVRRIPYWDVLYWHPRVLLFATTGCAVLVLAGVARRAGLTGLVLTQAFVVVVEFPWVGNHVYLELMLCLLCAFLDPYRPEERILFLRSARWLVCLVLFASGVQKLVHGYYFQGQFLAWTLQTGSFRPVLGLALPGAELARLVSEGRDVGNGPFLVSSPLFLAVSNGVYLAEMLLAVLLAIPRTRVVGVVGTLGVVAGIELAARELFFGLVFTSMVLLFLERDLHRRLVIPVAVAMLGVVLMEAGVLPGLGSG